MTLVNQAWGLLPILAYIGAVIALRRSMQSWSEAILRAIVVWAAVVWLLSNGLGAFGWLRPFPLKACWTVAATLGLILAFRAWRRFPNPRTVSRGSIARTEWAMIAAGLALLLLALTTAIAAPPVNVDVLNYHAPRQLFWLQQGSLAHFNTVNDRQLMMPPLAELIGLQFLALTGDDRWANLPNWFSYGMLALAVAISIRELGLSRRSALLGGLLVLYLPMAYQEASNGKNDLQGALWIAILLWEVLRARRSAHPPSIASAGWIGAVLALALLTKSTAFVFAPPLLLFWLFALARHGRRLALRGAAVVAASAMVLTAPFFARNFLWYGTPLGVHRAEDGGAQANTRVSVATIASNAIRDAAAHLAAPFEPWNKLLDRSVRAAHRVLGISENDPDTTLWRMKFLVQYAPGSETESAAPWHFILIGGCLVFGFRTRAPAEWRSLGFCLGGMILLYCAVVKWQPWGSRLQLPMFIVGIVFSVGVIEGRRGFARPALMWSAALGALLAWWPAREVDARPLWTAPSLFSVPRETNQYRHWPAIRERDEQMVAFVKSSGAHNVVITCLHDIAYPLMRRLQREVPDIHFHGAPKADASVRPDALIVLNYFDPPPLYAEYGDRYRLVGDNAGGAFYLPEARVQALGWTSRLPPFAGWSAPENFVLRIYAPSLTSDPVVWREMSASRAAVEFSAAGKRARLALAMAKSAVTPTWIELRLNDVSIGRVELGAASGTYNFERTLDCRPGSNRLSIVCPADAVEAVVFKKLVIEDANDNG